MDERQHKQVYSIGEFSKLSGVSRQTLQFYDRIKLFSPAFRAENGYRYYVTDQFDAIDIIHALKESGLKLSEIRAYLNFRTPELCLSLLDQETQKLRAYISSLEQTLVKLEQKKSSTLRGIEALKDQTLKFKFLPDAHLFTWDFSGISDNDFTLELFKMVKWCADNGYYTGYAMGSILSYKDVKTNNFSQINYMFTIIDAPSTHKNYRFRPSGLFAVYPYKGNYSNLPKAYPAILNKIQNAGYIVTGDAYETGLLDFFTTQNEDDYLIEIAIPI